MNLPLAHRVALRYGMTTYGGAFGEVGWAAGADAGTEAVFLVLEDRVDAVSIRAVRASTTCRTQRKQVGSTTCPARTLSSLARSPG